MDGETEKLYSRAINHNWTSVNTDANCRKSICQTCDHLVENFVQFIVSFSVGFYLDDRLEGVLLKSRFLWFWICFQHFLSPSPISARATDPWSCFFNFSQFSLQFDLFFGQVVFILEAPCANRVTPTFDYQSSTFGESENLPLWCKYWTRLRSFR